MKPTYYYSLSVLFSFLFSFHFSYGQNCENSDFEYGNFTNWTGYTGACCGGAITTPGIVSGRHTIITSSSLDPNTDNNITTMPPIGGGAYSVRLGNDNVGSEAERLIRSFTVNSSNQLFIYQYALVLQDPSGHPPIDKPKFEVRIFDENGDIIDPYECGYYQVTAGPETDTWGQYGEVRYKDWSTVGIDLTAYLGTVITVEFTVQDCGWGGHYGYAYLDATCGFLDIEVIGFCEGSTTVTLIAPDGFDEYFWPHSGEVTQIVTIPVPTVGDSVVVQVTNQSGCATSILHVFEELPLINAVAHSDTNLCAGQSMELWAEDAGEGGNYLWYSNGQLVSSDQFFTVTPLQNTDYQLIVSNGNGCYSPDSSASVTITVNDSLVFSLPIDTLICIGDFITIDGPVGNYGYLWSTQFVDSLSLNATISDNPLVNTNYVLQISNSTCTYTDSMFVTVNNAATLPDTILQNFCLGDSSLVISAPPGYVSYNWSNGEGTQSILINPYVDTLLQLNLVSTSNCYDSIIYISNETIAPIPFISNFNDTICKGSNSILFASSTGGSFIWTSIPSGYSNTGSSVSVSPDSTSTYVVQAISIEGCTDLSSFDTLTIYVDTTAYFDLGPTSALCFGQSDTLFGTPGMAGYSWFTDGSVVSTDSALSISPSYSEYYYLTAYSTTCSFTDYINVLVLPVYTTYPTVYSCVTNSSVVLNAPSAYTNVYWPLFNNNNLSNTLNNPIDNQIVEIFAENQYACTDTVRLIINVIDPSILNPVIDQTICFADYTNINASSSYFFDTYSWTSIPSGTNFSGPSLNINPNSSISYIVSLSNPYNCIGNPSVDTVTITVLDEHVIPPISPISICYGEEITIPSPGSVGQYTWNYLGTQSNEVFFNVTATQSGNIYLTVINSPCTDSETISITVNNPQEYSIVPLNQEICAGDVTTLSLDPSNFTTVNWYLNSNLISNTNTINVSPTTSTLYEVSILDNNGCQFDTNFQLVVNQIPLLELGPDKFICAEISTILSSSNSSGSADYLWSTSQTTPTIVVTLTDVYYLTIELNNCEATDSVYVEFNPHSFIGQIPNVITPNEDNINDEFYIESAFLEEFDLVIINRWGNTIFQSTQATDYWNGKSKNNDVEEGVYFYKIVYRLACEDEMKELHGNVTVTR